MVPVSCLGVRNLSPRIPVKLGGKSLHFLVSRNPRAKRKFAANILGEFLHPDFYVQFKFFWWTKSMGWRGIWNLIFHKERAMCSYWPKFRPAHLTKLRNIMKRNHAATTPFGMFIKLHNTSSKNSQTKSTMLPMFQHFQFGHKKDYFARSCSQFSGKKLLYVCCHQNLCLVNISKFHPPTCPKKDNFRV